MRLIKLTTIVLIITLFGNAHAQNPFRSLGVPDEDVKVLTLSNGRYDEHHEWQRYERVGNAVIDMETMTLSHFVDRDTIRDEAAFEPEVFSRWMSEDPLAEMYPEWSPYNYVMNNPIKYIDPDGRYVDNYVFNEEGKYVRTEENDQPDKLVIEDSESGERTDYEFNDPETDVAAIKYNIETFGEDLFKEVKFVYDISDARIDEMMTESNVSDKTAIGRYTKLATQSVKGKLDFSVYHLGIDLANSGEEGTWDGTSVFKNDFGPIFLFGGESYSYNYMDAGNFLWGNAVGRMGGSLDEAQILSRTFNRNDTKTDQRAIVNGWFKNKKKN